MSWDWVKGANTSRDKENVFIGFWPFQDSFLSGTLELPDFVDRATFGGSKRSNLLPWDRPSFAISGSAPKFSKKAILAGLF